MKKRYFYEFSGNVYLEANDETEAEKLAIGISLEDYLMDEELYEIDENYVAHNSKKREKQLGTHLHPFDDQDKYLEFKMRKLRDGDIFKKFLHGKFGRNEMMKRIAEAEKENLDDYAIVDEISMVDLESKKSKLVKQCFVE